MKKTISFILQIVPVIGMLAIIYMQDQEIKHLGYSLNESHQNFESLLKEADKAQRLVERCLEASK